MKKQRLILYRAKRYPDGEWVYGLPRYDTVEDGVITALETLDGKIHFIDVDTLGEYTGLTDKRDELRYEGDIVKIDGKYLRYVAYSGEHTAFCAMHYIDKQQSELTGTLGDGYDNYKRSYEVVGNIYDNHEILEVPF